MKVFDFVEQHLRDYDEGFTTDEEHLVNDATSWQHCIIFSPPFDAGLKMKFVNMQAMFSMLGYI